MHDVEPYYGWLHLYSHEQDPNSPFHQVEHNLFEFDRAVYNYAAHPLWEDIESESLLVKILYADYEKGFAILEFLGEWNDLFDNDYKLLAENVLTYLIDAGIDKFIFICENVFHIYLEADDYYDAVQDELEDGWICLLRAREHVQEQLREFNIDGYFYWSEELDALAWRKLKPTQLFDIVAQNRGRLLLE